MSHFPLTEKQMCDKSLKEKIISIDSNLLPILFTGDLHYLHIAKPSLEVPLSIHMMNPEYGTVLSTGEPAKSESNVDKFFRLHFNVYNTVETITCLSKQVNYSTLQGSNIRGQIIQV